MGHAIIMPGTPLICQRTQSKTIFRPPEAPPCNVIIDAAKIRDTHPAEAHSLTLSVSGRSKKYRRFFTYFFANENLKNQAHEEQLDVSVDSCKKMVHWKRCDVGALSPSGDVW